MHPQPPLFGKAFSNYMEHVICKLMTAPPFQCMGEYSYHIKTPFFFFSIKKNKPEISIVTILPGRDHMNTYSLGAVQEKPKRYKLQALPQVRLSHILIQPYWTSIETKMINTNQIYIKIHHYKNLNLYPNTCLTTEMPIMSYS
jgi:hypothetical protein